MMPFDLLVISKNCVVLDYYHDDIENCIIIQLGEISGEALHDLKKLAESDKFFQIIPIISPDHVTILNQKQVEKLESELHVLNKRFRNVNINIMGKFFKAIGLCLDNEDLYLKLDY